MDYEIQENKIGEMIIEVGDYTIEFDIEYDQEGRNYAGDWYNQPESIELTGKPCYINKFNTETWETVEVHPEDLDHIYNAIEENIDKHYDDIIE